MGQFNPFVGGSSEGGSGGTTNYNNLINKPFINGVELIGNQTSVDLSIIESKTKAEWDSTPNLMSIKDKIYIYTDYYNIDGEVIPAMKIGTGNVYLIDLPIMTFDSVTIEERISWNNKVTVSIEELGENLIFSND